ncbi:hypothetical protein BDY21DRAFT_386264 [Lineolata rhizophorae]|uniref:Glycoside hydrolase 131 catalytic N-terminal domain-containing protein n=1 Tax=Lineolata rhizophorae TaxID=578093 RepID=A0A6A6NZA1_9PEZI|nr:hypothetical protein BDY21DRAFT_386264 [Lineolata rhizophorae]
MSIFVAAATAFIIQSAAAQCSSSCDIVLDGRVPEGTTPSDFDSYSTSPFNAEYVKGEDLQWSEIVELPDVPPSIFDEGCAIPVEVTISDESIFNPSGDPQNGFRRAGLQIQGDDPEDPSSEGIKTFHWSVMIDPQRPLNYSHEYLLAWHETASYDANEFQFQTGSLIGRESQYPADTWKMIDRNNQVMWSTDIVEGEWQNFALTVDWDGNRLSTYYSLGDAPLELVSDSVYNNNAGDGQFQVGILKKPTGTSDVVNSGFQESGIDEGLIYGGIFVEDSASGCVTTE